MFILSGNFQLKIFTFGLSVTLSFRSFVVSCINRILSVVIINLRDHESFSLKEGGVIAFTYFFSLIIALYIFLILFLPLCYICFPSEQYQMCQLIFNFARFTF